MRFPLRRVLLKYPIRISGLFTSCILNVTFLFLLNLSNGLNNSGLLPRLRLYVSRFVSIVIILGRVYLLFAQGQRGKRRYRHSVLFRLRMRFIFILRGLHLLDKVRKELLEMLILDRDFLNFLCNDLKVFFRLSYPLFLNLDLL